MFATLDAVRGVVVHRVSRMRRQRSSRAAATGRPRSARGACCQRTEAAAERLVRRE
jgi:hypothetical protein